MTGRLILASSSPRRRELLQGMGFDFQVVEAAVDEHLTGEPGQVVKELARRKAQEVASRCPDAFVLGADTLVALGDQVLGKPRDQEDAARMLRLLSGAWHQVHTGVCLISPEGILLESEVTQVRFSPLSDAEIRLYCESGEPMGKAGSYAIQGMAGMFIPEIRGCYSNVVGLPTPLVWQMFKQSGLI